MKKQILFSLLILILLLGATIGVILYGNGYRFGFTNGQAKLSKTGILNVSSTPKGAQIYINDHLTSATNNAINLTPGKYTVKLIKDGYSPWQKDVYIKEQIVSNLDATLFPVAPALQNISGVGVETPILDPSGSKLAFRIASQSAKRNGIYVLDMTSRTFPVLALQSSATQIVDDTTDDFSKATLAWSPDGLQILASISGTLRQPTYYLLQADRMNDVPRDVTAILPSIKDTWQSQEKEKDKARLATLAPNLRKIITSYFKIIAWSPDDTKILYQATESAALPLIIKPRRIGNNLLYEKREIKKDGIYVYDTKEDLNTKILDSANLCNNQEPSCIEPLSWFPDSNHLIYVHEKKIEIVETDGANMTTIYAGPFIEPFVYPWPDGSKLVILTNFNNPTTPPTLYTVSLK